MSEFECPECSSLLGYIEIQGDEKWGHCEECGYVWRID